MRRLGVWLVAALLFVSAGCDRGSTAGHASPLGSALPTTCSSTSSPPIPDKDLEAAALNEPCLLTRLDLKATEGGRTLTLVGAYADPARIVLIVSPWPGEEGAPPVPTLTEDVEGWLNSGAGAYPVDPHVPGSDYILYFGSGFQAMAGRIAHIKATFRLGTQGPPGLVDPGVTIAFSLRVFTSTPLPASHSFQLGKWQVMFQALEATPAVIHVRALFVGAHLEDIPSGPPPNEPVTLLDEAGKSLREVSGTGSLESQGASLDMQWMRPLPAGTYHLNFQIPGALHTVTLNVPVMTIA